MYHDIDEDNNVLPGAHEVRERLQDREERDGDEDGNVLGSKASLLRKTKVVTGIVLLVSAI